MRRTILLAVLFITAGYTGTSNAGVIVQTGSVQNSTIAQLGQSALAPAEPIDVQGDTGSFQFALFDDSIGDLTGASLEWSFSVNRDISVFFLSLNPFPTSPSSASASFLANSAVSFTNVENDSILRLRPNPTQPLIDPSCTTQPLSGGVGFESSCLKVILSGQTVLSDVDFIDSGTVDLLASLSAVELQSSTSSRTSLSVFASTVGNVSDLVCSTGEPNYVCGASIQSTAVANWTLTYTYDAFATPNPSSPVPEPSSIALLGVAPILLGFARRRHHSRT